MSTNSTSLVIQYAINVQTATHGSFQMNDLSLLKLSKLYISVDITGFCKLYMLELTKASIIMLTALETLLCSSMIMVGPLLLGNTIYVLSMIRV